MSELNIWEIDDGERWIYCAESEDAAIKMYLEPMIGKVTDLDTIDQDLLPLPLDEMQISKYPDDFVVGITQDNGELLEKTAAEWAEEGPGLVGGTIW